MCKHGMLSNHDHDFLLFGMVSAFSEYLYTQDIFFYKTIYVLDNILKFWMDSLHDYKMKYLV